MTTWVDPLETCMAASSGSGTPRVPVSAGPVGGSPQPPASDLHPAPDRVRNLGSGLTQIPAVAPPAPARGDVSPADGSAPSGSVSQPSASSGLPETAPPPAGLIGRRITHHVTSEAYRQEILTEGVCVDTFVVEDGVVLAILLDDDEIVLRRWSGGVRVHASGPTFNHSASARRATKRGHA